MNKIKDWLFYIALIIMLSISLFLNHASKKREVSLKISNKQKIKEIKEALNKIKANTLTNHFAEDFTNKLLDTGNVRSLDRKQPLADLFQQQKYLYLHRL